MAKDYAKRVFTTSRTPKKKRWRIELFIIPVIVIAVILAWGHKNTLWVRVKMLTHKGEVKPALPSKPQPEKPAEPPVHFAFYNELPSMQMKASEQQPETAIKNLITTPVTKPLKISSQAPTSVEAPQYILQLGLFKDPTAAGQLRLSLLLSGSEADMVKIKSPEGEMYRVQRGPFATQAEATKLQRQLQKKGIVGEVKKISG